MACALFEPLKEDSSFRWEEPLLEGYGSAKGKGKMVNFHADVHQSMKGKRFLCTADGNCDEAFDSIELLMGHMRVHHRPTRFFRCEKCEQKFNTNRSLFKHLHVCLNHDEPGSVFGRRSTRATTGTTAAPPASILAAPTSVMAALPVTAAAAGADVAAVPCGAEGNPLGTTIDPSADITATAADVATAPPVADTAAAPVAVAAAPRGAVAALPSDVTVAPPDAASEERRAVDKMPELTCERAGAPPTLPPPPPPSPPLGLPSSLPMPKLKSSEQHEMPHLKLGPGRASNARRKRKRRIGRQGGTVEAPAEEAPSPVAVLLRPEVSAAPTLKRVLPSEDAMENSQGPASAVSDGSTEGASAVRHLAPPRLSRSSDESGEDGAPARTSLSKRKSKKVGGNGSKSTVTTAGSVAPPPAPPHGGEESGDDGVITAVSKVGKKKGAGRMGDLILPAGAPHLDSSCRPSLGEAESGTGVAARTSAPKGKKKATSAHPDTRSTAHGGGADGGDGGTAQAGPPKRRRKAVGRGSETRSRVVAAGKGAGKASTKTLLLKLRTDRAAGEETRWIREEEARGGDGSSCPGPALPPLLASQERGAAAVARDDASDRGCGALAMASGDTGASGTESPVADCDDRTPPPPASSPPPPPPPPACPVSAGCRGNTRVASTRAPTAPSAACAARRRRATSTSTAASARRANSGTQFVPWDKTTGH
ncbi:unnamed protein product [Lampetra planeri]